MFFLKKKIINIIFLFQRKNYNKFDLNIFFIIKIFEKFKIITFDFKLILI